MNIKQMAKLITTLGYEKEVTPANGKEFTLEELQGFIEGADAYGVRSKNIQIVPLASGLQMVANENGKLLGLKVNDNATTIWRKEYPKEDYPFNNTDVIVGNVVIGTPEEFGDEEEECTHEEYEKGRCIACGEYYEEDDFTGATPGDR